jgi:hypothetical protein
MPDSIEIIGGNISWKDWRDNHKFVNRSGSSLTGVTFGEILA